MRSILFAMVLCAAASAAPARRFALLVGANRGDASDQPLRYAEADAARLARVLRDLGGFHDLVELKTPDAATLEHALDDVSARVAAEAQKGRPALLLFYYSGHADADSLHIAGTRLPLDRLRAFLRDSPAAVRLAVLDSCKSGALTRVKGMHTAPAIELDLANDISTRGEALLTSSTSDELARESDALRGSFFTHHLVSGLRGAADQSKDGRVTLAEAYDYAYAKTVADADQHPTFKFDLAGKGDVVLTSLADAGSWLNFPDEGVYLILGDGGQLLGDVDVGKAPLKVGVAPGRYQVRRRTPNGDYGVNVVLALGEERWIHDSELQPLYEPWYGTEKGPIVVVPPPPVAVAPPPPPAGMLDNQLVADALRRRAQAIRRNGYGSLLGTGMALLTLGAAGVVVGATQRKADEAMTPANIGAQLLVGGSALVVAGELLGREGTLRLREADHMPPGATAIDTLLREEHRRGERRRRTGWRLLWGGLAALTVGTVLTAGSQGIGHDDESFIMMATGISVATLGLGMAAGGGGLIHSGRTMMRNADAGQLGPEFQLTVAPTGYAGGGGISMAGSF